MLKSSLDSTFIDRLKEILSQRYGKGLQIRQLLDLTQTESGDSFVKGRDLHIPIRVNGAFLGTAIVPSADDLDAEKKESVTQLVRMVLEPGMYRWYLAQKENNLQEITKANLELDNLRVFGDPMPDFSDAELGNTLDALKDAEKGELISQIIHLEGSNETTNKKVALQLHEMTSRWAFVPFNDIKKQLHSAMDLANLGEMTIFIEKVEDLNSSEQELLLDYLNEMPSKDEPLIITSSRFKMSELAAMPSLSEKIMDEISINSFEVDRAPLTTQGLREVLELFFLKDQPFHS